MPWKQPKVPSALPAASWRTAPAAAVPHAPCTTLGKKDSKPSLGTWKTRPSTTSSRKPPLEGRPPNPEDWGRRSPQPLHHAIYFTNCVTVFDRAERGFRPRPSGGSRWYQGLGGGSCWYLRGGSRLLRWSFCSAFSCSVFSRTGRIRVSRRSRIG